MDGRGNKRGGMRAAEDEERKEGMMSDKGEETERGEIDTRWLAKQMRAKLRVQ